jgi:SAM-dependent methyltransferase
MGNPYTREYYQSLREGARRSAEAIVPLVMGLLHPRSVIDVGCGDGTWLSVFRRHGVKDILGIDREYVSGEILEIPEGNFLAHDLRVPLALDGEFQLVVSLEVAEHLPDESAKTLIDSLTRLGPAILFSAAVPFQGGTDHVNEQWPDYWVDLFREKGFVPLDPIRKLLWERDDVDYWYRQNILLFVKREYLENRPELAAERKDAHGSQLSLVHPKMYLEMEKKCSEALQKLEDFSADAEKSREEAATQREEAATRREEAAALRVKIEQSIAEADRYREEAATQREEAAAQRKEAAEQRAKADFYLVEAEKYRWKAQPGNMSLKEAARAMPSILAGAFRRMRDRGRVAKSDRSDGS